MNRTPDHVVMREQEKVLWLQFLVHGDPVPQGSKRHVGNGIMVESSKNLKPWREDVKQSILALDVALPFKTEPVEVGLLFWIRRPKSHYGTGKNKDTLKASAPDYAPHRPDIDKLCRAVLDAMMAAGLLADDSQVAVLTAQKRYGSRPGLKANVRPLA